MLPDAETVKVRVEVLNTVVEAAGWLGGFVTLGTVGAAVALPPFSATWNRRIWCRSWASFGASVACWVW